MNRFLLSFAVLISLVEFSHLPAQGLLNGQVLDDSTGLPLAYVRLSLRQAQSGTLTNEEGQFRLLLTNNQADTLEVFVLGYVPKVLPVSELGRNALELRLKPRPLELETVTILSETPHGLLRRAMERIPDNYPDGNWMWEGFYREIEIWDFLQLEGRGTEINPQRTITLGEASIDVFMPSYDQRGDPEVRLRKGRIIRPEDMVKDSLDEEVLSMVEAFEEPGGPPTQAAFDVARDGDAFPFLKKRGDKWYDYDLRGVIEYQGRPAYRIDFAQRPEEESDKSLLDGTIYLDTASLAFVSIRYHLSESAKLYTPEFSGLGLRLKITDLEAHIEYRLRQGRWTLAYNENERKIYFAVPKGVVIRRDLRLEAFLTTRRQLLFTELVSSGAESIAKDEQFRNRESFSEEVGEYDPSFWDGKAILPVDQALLKE